MNPAEEIAAMLAAYERRLGIHICIYDYSGRLAAVTPPDRNHHRHAFCRHLIDLKAPCSAFDRTQVEKIIPRHPQGFFKRCHGDVLEFAAPVRDGETVLGVVLAGPFSLAKSDEPGGFFLRSAVAHRLDADGKRLQRQLPVLTDELQGDLPPMLRAFAGRIEALVVRAGAVAQKDLQRQWQVENLLARRFAQNLSLLDLARELNISASRARHLVVELFGKRFSELLRAQRLTHAKYLLTHTSLSVQQIAARCGFCDEHHFHKTFRRAERTSPHRFRKQNLQPTDDLQITK